MKNSIDLEHSIFCPLIKAQCRRDCIFFEEDIEAYYCRFKSVTTLTAKTNKRKKGGETR